MNQSIEKRLATLEQASGPMVYGIHDTELGDIVNVCNSDEQLTVAEFEQRYGTRGTIIRLVYVDGDDWRTT